MLSRPSGCQRVEAKADLITRLRKLTVFSGKVAIVLYKLEEAAFPDGSNIL